MTLWQARLGGRPADELWAFTASVAFDARLAPDDIRGSKAHVRALARAGLLDEEEASILQAALARVEEELAQGTFAFADGDEDIHTAVERRVTELAPGPGARLHAGRSRNDQVATDLRLYAKRAVADVARRILRLARVLLDRAESHAGPEAHLPGYTHLQRAQPVVLAHHLLAHGWALQRDLDRLLATRDRLDCSPLGAGALAGSSLPLDPDATAADLGFARRFENSLDAVSDRDFVAELLFDLTLATVHLSRLGEEVVLWSSPEVGFLTLDDAWATGSSMLPHKKNPDIAELARAKAGRLLGHLAGFLATLKALPLAYNRDLQEDKEPLFDAFDQTGLAFSAMAGLMATATFDLAAMREAASGVESSATDLAEWLVLQGHPFRTAHGIVAALVRDSTERGVPLAELVTSHPDLGEEAADLLAPGAAVHRRTTPGGAGPGPVADQLRAFAERLEGVEERVAHLG